MTSKAPEAKHEEMARLVRAVRLVPEGTLLSFDDSVSIARRLMSEQRLLAACKLALGAFENNHAIDWGVLEDAIVTAEALT